MTDTKRFATTFLCTLALTTLAAASGPGTRISSLPTTISSRGRYYLTGDLTLNDGVGIQVLADNVVIDLCGFALIGTDDAAVAIDAFMGGIRNITIENGSIQDWSTGIDTEGFTHVSRISVRGCESGIRVGRYSTVRQCIVEVSDQVGISVATGSTVIDCSVNAPTGDGIELGPGATAVRSYVTGAGTGFRASGNAIIDRCAAEFVKDFGVLASSACTVQGSAFKSFQANTTAVGLSLGAGSIVSDSRVSICPTGIEAARGTQLRNTTVFDCETGVVLADHTSFVGGEVFDCEVLGISVDGIGARIAETSVAGVGGNGIEFASGHGVVERCIVSGSTGDGLVLLGDSVAERNDLSDNGGAGLRCTADANRVEGNTLHHNDVGLAVQGRYNLLIGNRAFGSTTSDFQLGPKNPAGPLLYTSSWLTGAAPHANFATPLY